MWRGFRLFPGRSFSIVKYLQFRAVGCPARFHASLGNQVFVTSAFSRAPALEAANPWWPTATSVQQVGRCRRTWVEAPSTSPCSAASKPPAAASPVSPAAPTAHSALPAISSRDSPRPWRSNSAGAPRPASRSPVRQCLGRYVAFWGGITGVTVGDNASANFTVSSDSGTNWVSAAAAAVPEPGAGWLLAGPCLGLPGSKRRWR